MKLYRYIALLSVITCLVAGAPAIHADSTSVEQSAVVNDSVTAGSDSTLAKASETSLHGLYKQSASQDTVDWSGSLFPGVGKVLFALIVVIAGIYGTLWVLKRMMGRRTSGGKSGDVIELIETLHLAPKQSISIVRVGQRGVMLGVTEQGINALLELDDEETKTALEHSKGKQANISFVDAFSRAKQRISDVSGYIGVNGKLKLKRQAGAQE